MTRPLPPFPDPMPPNSPLFRRVREGMRSALGLFQAGAFELGGVGRHPMPTAPGAPRRCAYTVREPDLIRRVLVDRPEDFPKSVLMDDMLRDLIGESIFTANGETWRWRRAVVDPALAQARVKAVFGRMLQAAEASVGRIEAAADRGPLAIDREVTHFAADVIFRTLFSEPIGVAAARRMIAAFERFQGVAYAHGMMRQLGLPAGLAPGALVKFWNARGIRRALAAPLNRRLNALTAGEPVPNDDIVSSLIAGADPRTGRRFDRTELLDEIAMLFLAGHETSASALAWSLYLLATHPEIQARLAEEAHQVLADRAPEFGDIRSLVLARNVFREALRLYPPVAVITRDARQCENMADREVEPGSLVFVTPWVMHRQGRFWPRANAFDPDRFESRAGKEAARQAYLPFSMGPRVCPGAAFALQEGTLLLAMIARAFHLEPAPDHVPRPVARLTLRSANGVRLVVSRRPTS